MKLFDGELMTCSHCGWQYQSSPNVESQWTILQVDDELRYLCPVCWPVPRSRWPQDEVEAWDRDHPKGEKK